MRYKDYYALLEIKRTATQDEIKKAYRKFAKQYHPDSNIGNLEAEEKIKEINEAYEVLSDEKKKKKYDTIINRFNFMSGIEFDPKKFGFSKPKKEKAEEENAIFSDFFNLFFGNEEFDFEELSFDDDIEEEQELLFKKGEDLEVEHKISLEEAFFGGKTKVEIRELGNIVKEYEIEIPAGIRDGEKIRLLGKGKPGTAGSPPGDLYIKIAIANDNNLVLKGMDLQTDLLITPWEAALGGRAVISTIDSKLDIGIPSGIQAGSKLRIKGKGYINNQGRGDLIANIKIVMPKEVTHEEKKLYEQLAKISKFSPREQ
ncbi:MAG: J domain-containing protein [Clostridiales bacterium]|nr:J domain-containing protein [Clostridiales bacterium]